MFAAIGRYLRVFFYRITGQVDAAAQLAATNPHVMNAQYAEVIREKTLRAGQFLDAVANNVFQNEKKIAELEKLEKDIKDKELRITGATEKAKQRVAELMKQSKTAAEIKADLEVMKCQNYVRDNTSTLAEMKLRATGLETDIKENEKKIANRKLQAITLKREIAKIKQEQGDAVADVIMSQEEERANKLIAELSEDTTSKTLEGLRAMRGMAKAKAKVSEMVAETDAARADAEFDAFAQNSEADKDFFSNIGLADAPKTETADAAPDAKENDDPLA